MTLHIEEREAEGIAILDLTGSLTAGEGDTELRNKLLTLHREGKVDVVLNLKDVSHMDSTGLGGLVFGLAKLRKAGGTLVLLNLSRAHVELFMLTRLALAFDLFEDEQEAVNSFFPDRAVRKFDVLSFVQAEEARKTASDLDSAYRPVSASKPEVTSKSSSSTLP